MKGLVAGVPIVCMPTGRDQPDNAVRLTHRGAGLRISKSASPARIAAAVQQVLTSPSFRQAATGSVTNYAPKPTAAPHSPSSRPWLRRLTATGPVADAPGRTVSACWSSLSSFRMVAGSSSRQDTRSNGGARSSGLSEELVLLRRAKDRIDREFAEPLDVESIARGVGMSAGHFSRRFRQAYGEAPYSHLMTRRVERAMVLLRRRDQSVTSVCFAVGFSSPGHSARGSPNWSECRHSAYRDHDPDGPQGSLLASPCERPNRSGIEKPVREESHTVATMEITIHQTFCLIPIRTLRSRSTPMSSGSRFASTWDIRTCAGSPSARRTSPTPRSCSSRLRPTRR